MVFSDKDITLTDLIDVKTLQKIQDAFADATGMAALTVDLNGAVTQLSNPTEFCMKLTRGCPKGAERCNQCDLKGGEEAGRTGRPSVYYCHGGLMDFAAPILLGNRQIGSMIGGQILPSPPDVTKFRAIAREIGVNEDNYIQALSKIKIVPKKTIEASAKLLYVIANELSEMGYQRYLTRNVTQLLLDTALEMHDKIRLASEHIFTVESKNKELTKSMDQLSSSARKSKSEADKTGEIVKYISDVTMQTKLLGFNASVEAARAREYGEGFSIIAQEIRKLADDSQSRFGEIDEIIGTIKTTVSDIDSKIGNTSEIALNSTNLLEQIASIMKEIDGYASKLESLGKK